MRISALIGVSIFLLIPCKGVMAREDRLAEIENEIQQMAEEQLDLYDTDAWEDYLGEFKNYNKKSHQGLRPKDMILNMIKGNFEFSWQGTLQTLSRIFFSEITFNLTLMSKIIVIALTAGILDNFKSNFCDSSVGELAWFVCYMMIVVLIIQSVTLTLDVGKRTMEQMTSFMRLIIPILLSLLISMGGVASSGILQPTLTIISGVTGIFLNKIMMPLILLSTVLILIGNLSERIKLEKLSKLVKNLCAWILGIIFTIFVGVLSIQGLLATSFDGVSIRTTKYTIEAFVPVVGKLFSQTVDIVIGCSAILKNAIGTAGLIIIIGICILPIIKILTLMFLFKLSSAILEPVGDKKIIACLDGIGGSFLILFITLLGVALMFFIIITLLIGIGNMTIMMR